MTEEFVMGLGTQAIKTAVLLAGPMLMAAMVVGVIVSVLQAVTQINEATLTFIPKIAAVLIVIMILAPWMLEVLQSFAKDVLGNAGEWVR